MLPDGWSATTLGEIVEPEGLQTGPFGSQLKASEYRADGVPVIMPKDIVRGRVDAHTIARVPESVATERLERHRVKPGDVVFGRRGDIGRCALITAQETGWLCGTGCLRARLGPNVVPPFLVHQLLWHPSVAWLAAHAVGQTMLNLNTDILSRLPLVLPPLEEQRKIAAILSAVDETIAKTEAVIEQLQVVKKAMLQELLTRGLPGRHTRFTQTSFGKFPQAWRLTSLGELIEHGPDNGLYRPQEDYGDGTPIVRINSFRNGGDLPSSGFLRVRLADDDITRYALQARDILINRVNSIEHIGKATFVGDLPEPTVFESNMMRISVHENAIDARYAFHWISSAHAYKYFRKHAKRAIAQASINQQDVRRLPVPVPPRDEQAAIVACIDGANALLLHEEHVLQGLSDTKSALMSALLTGQIRVQPEETAP